MSYTFHHDHNHPPGLPPPIFYVIYKMICHSLVDRCKHCPIHRPRCLCRVSSFDRQLHRLAGINTHRPLPQIKLQSALPISEHHTPQSSKTPEAGLELSWTTGQGLSSCFCVAIQKITKYNTLVFSLKRNTYIFEPFTQNSIFGIM